MPAKPKIKISNIIITLQKKSAMLLRSFAAMLSLFFAMSLCACGKKVDDVPLPTPINSDHIWQALETPKPEPSFTPVVPSPTAFVVPVTPSPSPSSSPVIENTLSPSPVFQNSVEEFYFQYYNAAYPVLYSLKSRLADEIFTVEGLRLSLFCDAHCRFSSLLGQAAPNFDYEETADLTKVSAGTIKKAEYGYAFEYVYENGNTLKGEYHTDDHIEFSLFDSNSLLGNCTIIKMQTKWVCTVNELDDTTVFSLYDDKAVFAHDTTAAVLKDDVLSIEYINAE